MKSPAEDADNAGNSRNSGKRSALRRALRAAALLLVLVVVAAGGYWFYVTTITTNFHAVVPGEVYRSAQPGPDQLQRWARRYGLKTVINLRGASRLRFYEAERKAAREAGLTMIDIRLTSQDAPSALWIRRLIEALRTAERPLLIHCQAGADRTGVASVLAAMAVGGQDYAAAKGQLSAKYLHVNPWKNRIVELLEEYEDYCRRNAVDTAGWAQFRRWAVEDYHPHYYRVEIAAPAALSARPGQKLTASVEIRNTSLRTIPAGDPAKTFTLAVFTGTSTQQLPDSELGPRTALTKKDIPSGQSVRIEQPLIAPQSPGTYQIHFDLIEEHRTWFARQGSPVPTCELTVQPAVEDR